MDDPTKQRKASPPPLPAENPPNADWYYGESDTPTGPIAFQALKELLATGQLPVDALVWREGFAEWQVARDVSELRVNTSLPPPLPKLDQKTTGPTPGIPAGRAMLDHAPGNKFLIEEVPYRIESALAELLSKDEIAHVKLKGAFKEALICTDRRVLIVKGGYLTGQIFGTNAFQLPYANVAGVEVKFHLFTGYFELSAGGMQNVPKSSYWNANSPTNPARAPNCVSLNSRQQATKFREACSFILKKQAEVRRGFIER